MLKRKIIKLAEKTLVVSLPASWVNAQQLSKGDELAVAIDDYKLILSPPEQTATQRKISISIKDIDERTLRWQISSLHKQGYDEIEVCHYTPQQQKIIEELLEKLFVGFMIKEQSSLRIIIGQIALVDAKEFDTTLRRVFRLITKQLHDCRQAFLQQDTALLASQLTHETTNNKLTNFCERLLNNQLSAKDKGHFWYVIIWNLEKISDNFKYIAQHYGTAIPESTPSLLDLFDQIVDLFNGYYTLMYNFSFSLLHELANKKRNLDVFCLELLESQPASYKVLLHYLHIVVMQTADFSASFIALHFSGDSN